MIVVVQEAVALRITDVVGVGHELVIVALIHHVGTGLIFHTVDLDLDAVHIGLGDEVLTVARRQLVPIPPGDDIVQAIAVAFVVNEDLVDRLAVVADGTDLHRRTVLIGLVGIEVGLHVEQLQLTVRCSGNGQRQVYLLRVGVSRTGIG